MIRTATPDDLPFIVAIHNQAISEEATAHREPFDVEDRREWFRSHERDTRPVLVNERDGVIMGWASFADYRPGRPAVAGCCEISFFVDRQHRRQGIARDLVEELILRAPGLAVTHLLAILIASNEGSRVLLGSLGFEEWGRLPGVVRMTGGVSDHLYLGRRV